MEDEEILNLKETAQLLRVKPKRVYLLAKNGKLPGAKVGGRWRFVKSQILKWFRKSRKQAKDIFYLIICVTVASSLVLLELSSPGIKTVEAEEPLRPHPREVREIKEKEEKTGREENELGASLPIASSGGEGKANKPWWEVPGYETVLAILGCAYFIIVKFFLHLIERKK